MALSSPADLSVTTALGVLQAIIPALLMNICIVGFNQLCDVEIDKVRAHAAHIVHQLRPHCDEGLSRARVRQMNKPYLPLASGDFSFALGQTLVVICGALALVLGAFASHARTPCAALRGR